MIKIKTREKSLPGDGEQFDFKLSLLKNDFTDKSAPGEYTIVSETSHTVATMPAGKNFGIAQFLFDLFFQEDVLPENLEGIADDIKQKNNCL